MNGFKAYSKLNENEEEEPFRLYGRGTNSKQELIKQLKDLIAMINRMNPITEDDFEQAKFEIKDASDAVKTHPDYNEFKTEGFEWQDQTIKMSDWKEEFDRAIANLYQKVSKRGLI